MLFEKRCLITQHQLPQQGKFGAGFRIVIIRDFWLFQKNYSFHLDEVIHVSIASAEVTSTQDVINNQSITNFNEESIIECVDETFNETVDETLNEANNETFNEATINETFNDTNLIEDEDELFLVLQPPQQVGTHNFLNLVDFF